MKRLAAIIFLGIVLGCAGFAQLRMDVGVEVPMGIGALEDGSLSSETFDLLGSGNYFPFPEAGLYWQFGQGRLKASLGLRAFTVILLTLAWPNLVVDWDLGPLVLEGQVGGGVFGLLGAATDIQTGAIAFPDLSIWLKLGKSLRLGAGVLGLFVPDLAEGTLPFIYYLGSKFVFSP